MSIELVGMFTLVAGGLALTRQPAFAFTILLCTTLLGAAAALLVPGLGTIQPGQLMLGFALLIVLRSPDLRNASVNAVRFPSAGFWLASTCCYGLVSAAFFPKLFAGQFEINAVSTPEYAQDYFLIPMKTTNGNITQSIYLIGNMVCFCMFVAFASSSRGFVALSRACLVYGTLNICFAGADILTSHTNTSYLLEFMRNATYLVYADSAVGNFSRIIGSFSEASAFAYATMGIFCFALRLWLGGQCVWWSLTVAIASLSLLVLSTSSTALVALGPSLLLIYLGSLWRLTKGDASRQDASLLLMTPLLFLTSVCCVLCFSDIRIAVVDYLNNAVFSKSLSISGIDRARLNRQALEALFQTNLVGAGLGSIKASGFIFACLSNIGVPGSILYALFIARTLAPNRRREPCVVREIRAAAKCGCVGLLSAAVVSGGLTDLGLAFFAFAALAVTPNKEQISLSSKGAPADSPLFGKIWPKTNPLRGRG